MLKLTPKKGHQSSQGSQGSAQRTFTVTYPGLDPLSFTADQLCERHPEIKFLVASLSKDEKLSVTIGRIGTEITIDSEAIIS